MWKYIVTWALIEVVYGGCPPPPTVVDEFGRESGSNTVLSVSCRSEKLTAKRKEFTDRNEAFAFYRKGKKESKAGESFFMQETYVKEFSIDSFFVDTTRTFMLFKPDTGSRTIRSHGVNLPVAELLTSDGQIMFRPDGAMYYSSDTTKKKSIH